MSNDQKRKAKKKKEAVTQKRRDAERQYKFIDGIDKYTEEYHQVLAKPPLHGLYGVFELGDNEFYNQSTEEKLSRVGLADHTYLDWRSEYSSKGHSKDDQVHGAGFACAVFTRDKRLLPVIFTRRYVHVEVETKSAEEVANTIRLLILLHEVGHAEDMIKQINFNHHTQTVDLVAAEAYAHLYAMRHLQKRNCRLALSQYIGQLDKWIRSDRTEEYVRLAAIRVADIPEVVSMRSIAKRSWQDGGWQKQVAESRITQRLKNEGSI